MPTNEAYLDAPRELRRVAYRGGSFTDHLGGVSFVDSVAQSGMAASTLARLVGLGITLDDLGPWEDAPAPTLVAEVAVLDTPPPSAPVEVPAPLSAREVPSALSTPPVEALTSPRPSGGSPAPQRPRR